MTAGRLCALALLTLLTTGSAATNPPRIAIIIDDLGYRFEAGQRAIKLPGQVSFAVLPGTPRARALAALAFESGKEVLLHLPLQATSNDTPQDPLGINLDMSRQELGDTFDRALASVPHAIGVNSHRGSMLTRHPGHMQWLMDEIHSRKGLFFIDSFTTHHSIALKIALETGVDARKRDVFLDPDKEPETVAREFERMKRLAHERGSVVAIGHPYTATLELLEREIPKLAGEGIELVAISALVRQP
jgi:polysaccharide deacetylase 2 family uncharacterized protein YibQ